MYVCCTTEFMWTRPTLFCIRAPHIHKFSCRFTLPRIGNARQRALRVCYSSQPHKHTRGTHSHGTCICMHINNIIAERFHQKRIQEKRFCCVLVLGSMNDEGRSSLLPLNEFVELVRRVFIGI